MFLLQNYRYGAVAVNSLLLHVGFCVYKVRVEIVFLIWDYRHGAVSGKGLLVIIG